MPSNCLKSFKLNPLRLDNPMYKTTVYKTTTSHPLIPSSNNQPVHPYSQLTMTTPTDNYNPLSMMVEYPCRISTPILLEQITPVAIEVAMTGARLQEHAMQAAAHAVMIAQVPRAMNTTLTIAISTFTPHLPIASIAKRHHPQRREQPEDGEFQIVDELESRSVGTTTQNQLSMSATSSRRCEASRGIAQVSAGGPHFESLPD